MPSNFAARYRSGRKVRRGALHVISSSHGTSGLLLTSDASLHRTKRREGPICDIALTYAAGVIDHSSGWHVALSLQCALDLEKFLSYRVYIDSLR